MHQGKGALSELPKGCAFYSPAGANDNDGILITLAPGLAVSLSECILGAKFSLAAGEENPTGLDQEIVRSFIEDLRPLLNDHLLESSSGHHGGYLKSIRACATGRDNFQDAQPSAIFSVSIDFQIGEKTSAAQMVYHFPVEFLERRGLLEQDRKKNAIVNEKSRWQAAMLSNVENTEIELSIVLDKYKTTLSDLSRLEVGHMVPLDGDALHSLDITMRTGSGILTLGKGRLGTFKKFKAVKIISDLGPGLLSRE